MGTFDLWRKMCQSDLSESERVVDGIQYDVEFNFYNSPSYHKIELNTEDFDVQITDESSLNKNPNKKRILALPSYTFKKGDLVYWNSAYWMITNIDADVTVQYRGIIEKCNNVLKNYDSNGVLHIEPCIIDTKIINTDFDYNSDIILGDGTRVISLQYNAWTSTFYENQRFIFGGQAWKCTQIDNFQKSDIYDEDSVGIIYITVTKDEKSVGDDLVNNIPDTTQHIYSVVVDQDDFQGSVGTTGTLTASAYDGGILTTEPITFTSSDTSIASINTTTGAYTLLKNGNVTLKAAMTDNALIYDTVTVTVTATVTDVYQVIVTPNVTEIYEGESQTYTCTLIKNNVAQSNAVTPVASGISTNYYSMSIIDGNHFYITNKKAYSGAKLLITCTSGAYNSSISITMKGAF